MIETRAILEAVLFVAEEPITTEEFAELLEIPAADVALEIERFAADIEAAGRGIVLRRVGGGWRLYTTEEARPYLEKYAASDRATKLSAAALETLAVVAYKQPVSRGQVSEIRGVDSDRALRTLERRGLVVAVGHAGGSGQAILYGTRELFLEKMGLNGIGELPPLADHVPPADVMESLERPFRPEGSSTGSRS
jgi:segregation and condensation protein B